MYVKIVIEYFVSVNPDLSKYYRLYGMLILYVYIFKISYERPERHPALSPPSFSSALRLGPPIKMIPHPPAASKTSRLEGPASRYDRVQNEPPRYPPSRFVL